MDDNIIDHRDRIYARYLTGGRAPLPSASAEIHFRGRAPYTRRLVTRHFGMDKAASIVDLGCGDGAILHFARLAGFTNCIGVDRSEEQVSLAARLGVQGVRLGRLEDFLERIETASTDIVVAFDVLEHLRKAELLKMVDEVKRILRPSGRWVVHVPNAASPFFGSVRYGDFTHELAFTSQSLTQVLVASGFSSVECFEDTPIAHGIASTLRAIVWSGCRLAMRACIVSETGALNGGLILSQNFLAVARC